MHRSRALDARAIVARFLRRAAFTPGLRERAAHVAERAVDELEQRILNLDAPRGSNFRAVAFRYTQPMVDVTSVLSHLDVEDLYAERCQRAHERLEDAALRRQSQFDERQRTACAVDERDQRLGNTQHVRR